MRGGAQRNPGKMAVEQELRTLQDSPWETAWRRARIQPSGHSSLLIVPCGDSGPSQAPLWPLLQEAVFMAACRSPLVPAHFHGASAVCLAWCWDSSGNVLSCFSGTCDIFFFWGGGGILSRNWGTCDSKYLWFLSPCCLQVQGVLRSRRNGMEAALVQTTL
uniref:Uncharacterized protein n=1 Tax=Pipistrellus kuhlii TaxID=59472 RepID=A0A7J8B1H0_PIPKU|nr:hypothetical protein mPipKuh1_007806 [Pipistrellus kuhlii]